MLNGSTLIKGRWKITKKIGAGAFGEIYAGKNIISSQQVAIKVERADSKKQVLKLEVAVLKKVQPSPYACRFITCGRYGDYNYLIMELLGENLSELRRRIPSGRFSMVTTLKLGMHFIRALQSIHEFGFVHRDVKPSNFVIGPTPETAGSVFIIDFGLARRFVDANGQIKASRDQSGFRGTARYASINSHLSKDLGRRDDLWSVLYILIEFALGNLPWRRLKDKEQIGQMKIKTNTPDLVADLPPEFLQFMQHLQALDYSDRPDYDYLVSLLQSRFTRLGGTDESLYEWQNSGAASMRSSQQNQISHLQLARSEGADGTGNTDPYRTPGAASVSKVGVSIQDASESSEEVRAHPQEQNRPTGGFGLPQQTKKYQDGYTPPKTPESATRDEAVLRPIQSPLGPESAAAPGHVYKLVANKKLVSTAAGASAAQAAPIRQSAPSSPAHRLESNDSDEEYDDRAEQSSDDRAEDDDRGQSLEEDMPADLESPTNTPASKAKSGSNSPGSEEDEDSSVDVSSPAKSPTRAPVLRRRESDDSLQDQNLEDSSDKSVEMKHVKEAAPRKAVVAAERVPDRGSNKCCAGCSLM